MTLINLRKYLPELREELVNKFDERKADLILNAIYKFVAGVNDDLQGQINDITANGGGGGSTTTLEGYSETGKKVDANLKVVIGDYTDEGNGYTVQVDDENGVISLGDTTNTANNTHIVINDTDEFTKLNQKTLLINTDKDTVSESLNVSVYQKDEDGGETVNHEINTLKDYTRTKGFSSSARYNPEVLRLTDISDDDTTGGGTKVLDIQSKKTGKSKMYFQYAVDLTSEVTNGEVGFFNTLVIRNKITGIEPLKVSYTTRSLSSEVTIDNPNAEVNSPLAMYNTLNLKQGTLTNQSEVLFLGINCTSANLGTNLNIEGDLTYLRGTSNSNIEALKTYMSNKGLKLRFIWSPSTVESDFNGIINYLGDIVNLDNATEKALINKEWVKKRVNTYSTTEKEIGTWIDNKTIYRTVLELQGSILASKDTINHNLNIDTYIETKLLLLGSKGNDSSVVYSTSDLTSLNVMGNNVNFDTNEIVLDSWSTGIIDGDAGVIKLILEYTKN